MKGYQGSKKEILEKLKVKEEEGLSTYEATRRLEKFGKNEISQKKQKNPLLQFLKQFQDPMVYILLFASIISLLMKEYVDTSIILFVIVVNACISFFQEYKAEKALQALQALSAPKAKVKRDGFFVEIDACDLVLGDIVQIEAGNRVPADMRLLSSTSLMMDESILTGESDVVRKDDTAILSDKCPLHEQKNMVFMSTFVSMGHATGVICVCANESEVGKVASLLEEENKEKTPLQKRLNQVSKYLGIATLAICAVMFLIYYIQGRNVFDILLLSISLAVAAIPEGLVAVVSIVLALGVQNMSKHKAIVKTLPAVETLGSVSVICSDKTGTLTQNKMQVKEVRNAILEKKTDTAFLSILALCNHVEIQKEGLLGDATEKALVQYALQQHRDVSQEKQMYPCVYEIPFTSANKYMVSVHKIGSEYYAYMKGAMEAILPRCSFVLDKNNSVLLTAAKKEEILKEVNQMSMQGLRVLALAQKRIPYPQHFDKEANYVFVGLIGLKDPAREGVKESIQQCQKAGIKVVMISGDSVQTAFAIAKELQITKDIKEVITGKEMEELSDVQLQKRVKNTSVFARVTPKDKVRIVNAFKQNHEVVAMSGDGVNDAPALKRADIGVAMGKNGSDVCKQSGDMILADDNFSTIVKAVEEGRNIYLNIQKAVLYLLSCNLGEIMALFLATLCMPNVVSTLSAVQILWVNLVTDSFPALALGVDPKDQFIMQEKPRDSKESLFAHGGISFTLLNGMLIGTITIVAFRYGYNTSDILAQTMAFMVLSISQLFHALNLTSRTHSLFEVKITKNRWLLLTILFGIGLQICVCHIPIFQFLLKTTALGVKEWMLVFMLSILPIVVNECSKWFAKEK